MDFKKNNPVAIGGVGGSGTRLIAQLLQEFGYYIGSDLNESFDNLWFTYLFKRYSILELDNPDFKELLNIFIKKMLGDEKLSISDIKLIKALAKQDRDDLPLDWLQERARTLVEQRIPGSAQLMGWKEPNTHIIMDRLRNYCPDLKYIHVIRNGLDMAYSSNQNQLRLWAKCFLGTRVDVSPYYSLKYWHIVHQRILRICHDMDDRFILLNYDEFCTEPENGINLLSTFLGLQVSSTQMGKMIKMVSKPNTMGRYKKYGLSNFDPDDVAFVHQLGFDVSV